MLKLIPILFLMVSCSHTSTFDIEPDEKKDNVFQYCGGQQWGYIQKINAEGSPYLAVYFETFKPQDKYELFLNVVVQSHQTLKVQLGDKKIKIEEDGKVIENKAHNFWTIRGEKTISQRFNSDKYVYERKEGSENEWLVYKKKYGGFFGGIRWFLEDPYTVIIEKHPNQEIKGNSVEMPFDKEKDDEVYVFLKEKIPHSKKATSKISIHTPELHVNGAKIPKQVWMFNWNQAQLEEKVKNAYRCASMSEIFRHERRW